MLNAEEWDKCVFSKNREGISFLFFFPEGIGLDLFALLETNSKI